MSTHPFFCCVTHALRVTGCTVALLIAPSILSSAYAQDVAYDGTSRGSIPLLRASIPVELIDAAHAQENTSDEDAFEREEDELRRMEAELLKTLDNPTDGRMPQKRLKDDARATAPNLQPPSDLQPAGEKSAPAAAAQPASYPILGAPAAPQPSELEELKSHPALSSSSPKVGRQAPSRQATLPRAQPRMQPAMNGSTEVDQKLAIAESQVKILSRELDISRRSLASAEERIDELSDIVKSSDKVPSARPASQDAPAIRGSLKPEAVNEDFAVSSGPVREKTRTFDGSLEVPTQAHEGTIRDSSVASVVLERAPLRVAPGKLESAIYLLPRTQQVRVEYRSGEWYRVVVPGGLRGWVYGSSLRFDSGIPANSTVRIGGVRAAYEPVSYR